MFVNKANLFDESYRRFVVGQLSQLLPVAEVPIRLFVRAHRASTPPPEGPRLVQKAQRRQPHYKSFDAAQDRQAPGKSKHQKPRKR
jgi:hypothetical protein